MKVSDYANDGKGLAGFPLLVGKPIDAFANGIFEAQDLYSRFVQNNAR